MRAGRYDQAHRDCTSPDQISVIHSGQNGSGSPSGNGTLNAFIVIEISV